MSNNTMYTFIMNRDEGYCDPAHWWTMEYYSTKEAQDALNKLETEHRMGENKDVSIAYVLKNDMCLDFQEEVVAVKVKELKKQANAKANRAKAQEKRRRRELRHKQYLKLQKEFENEAFEK